MTTATTLNSKHKATLTINTAEKSVIISYKGKQSQNLYGKTFSTQVRKDSIEYYIPAEKVNGLDDYIDEKGQAVKNFVFSCDIETSKAVAETLKPNGQRNNYQLVNAVTKKQASITTDLKAFADSIDDYTATALTKSIADLKEQIKTLDAKLNIAKLVTANDEKRKQLADIADKSQQDIDNRIATVNKEKEQLQALGTVVSTLPINIAEAVIQSQAFKYHALNLKQADNGNGHLDYAYKGIETTATDYADILTQLQA